MSCLFPDSLGRLPLSWRDERMLVSVWFFPRSPLIGRARFSGDIAALNAMCKAACEPLYSSCILVMAAACADLRIGVRQRSWNDVRSLGPWCIRAWALEAAQDLAWMLEPSIELHLLRSLLRLCRTVPMPRRGRPEPLLGNCRCAGRGLRSHRRKPPRRA